MSPQQIAMIEALQKRGIDKVVVKPTNQLETECAEALLDKRTEGDYSATIKQLKAYYERQRQK